MPLPDALKSRLRLPLIAAPMFLVSGPDLVVATAESMAKPAHKDINPNTPRRWKDVWSAGHSVQQVDGVPSVAELVERISIKYNAYVRNEYSGNS